MYLCTINNLKEQKMTISVSYKFKGKNLISTNSTNDESMVSEWIEICDEEIKQNIRHAILDECIGWEKAQEKEHKILSDFEKNKVIQITK
tara:strand:+ start:569 stop:838 length:270 start_codon:yes stop_codon:yes gene_type:complete